MTKQDITKSVAISAESVNSFWGVDPNMTNDYVPISICHEDNPLYFPQEITIHKGYQGEKDWRICGNEWKKLYAHEKPEEGDIMEIRKMKKSFSVKIVKKDSEDYKVLSSLFVGNDNYVIISSDSTQYIDEPLQQIFYGAPGTGKSHRIKRDTAGMSIIRTTFHPDSDYSTFVGAYKPVMEDMEVRVVPVVLNNGASFDQNNGTLTEKRISYKFVKQAFLKAYLGAWKKYAEAEDGAEPQFLIIEEINRGNCAQIFGDLFQLLDRNDENDFSTYPIDADTDLQKEIEKAFKEEKDGESDNPYKLSKDIDVEGAVDSYISNYGASLSKDIQEGRVLLLPPNLYIWATMNTSDQSLFPIDSAFKRRWAWEYVKITDGKKGWMIQGADYSCDWWTFIQEINKKIATATSSDDKKLGYYFCKAKNNTICIDEKLFVSKVIFYLWNDVFKDNDNTIFKVTESTDEPSFDDFYMENEDGEIVPKSSAVKQFLINVVGEENVSTVQSQTDEQEQTTQPTEQDLATQPTE